MPRERIQAFGDPENFWSAGPTGPAARTPSSSWTAARPSGPRAVRPWAADRYLEYWNLVFMQYDRAADGALTPLPSKNIDTGAGLERLAAILQDVPSVFDTDAFRPLLSWAEGASGRRYGADPESDRALRVLADHGRAMTFLAADGVRPSNEGAATSCGASSAGPSARPPRSASSPMPSSRWPAGGGRLGRRLPELRQRAARCGTSSAPRPSSSRTLTQGRRLLGEVIERSRASGTVSGATPSACTTPTATRST